MRFAAANKQSSGNWIRAGKNAAKELGISERTLYRKIKQHNLGDVSEF